jgi:transcriptional regulator with XRE-family HTH domain
MSSHAAVDVREIRALMARNELNQQALATRIGLTRTGLYRRLRGEVDFSATELASVATTFGVPVDTLFTPTPADTATSAAPAGVSAFPAQ